MMVGSPADRPPASETLQRLGFTPFETVNLLELKRRYERGALDDTLPAQRLEFARWQVRMGHLSEGQIEPSPRMGPDGARTFDDPLPTRKSEDPHSETDAYRPTTAAAERCNVRGPCLVPPDEPIPQSGPTAPSGLIPMGGRLRAGVFAVVILLSVFGVVGAYALIAAFGG